MSSTPSSAERAAGQRFTGTRIVVTGSASGIGAATAELLRAEGAEVIGLDVQPGNRPDDGTHDMICDVSDPTSVDSVFAAIAERSPSLDGLVTAAGVNLTHADVVGTTLETWERTIRVNLTGTFLVSKAAIPLLRKGRGRSIVHVASQLALAATTENPAYIASKGGVLSLSRAMALDHASESIRVNAVCPGPTDTPMLRASTHPEAREHEARERIPLRRLGRAEESAAAIAFLLSDEASFVTGSALVVDGGWTTR